MLVFLVFAALFLLRVLFLIQWLILRFVRCIFVRCPGPALFSSCGSAIARRFARGSLFFAARNFFIVRRIAVLVRVIVVPVRVLILIRILVIIKQIVIQIVRLPLPETESLLRRLFLLDVILIECIIERVIVRFLRFRFLFSLFLFVEFICIPGICSRALLPVPLFPGILFRFLDHIILVFIQQFFCIIML